MTIPPRSELSWTEYGLKDVQPEQPSTLRLCWDAANRFVLLSLLFSTWLSTLAALIAGAACTIALHLWLLHMRNDSARLAKSLPEDGTWPVSVSGAQASIKHAIDDGIKAETDPAKGKTENQCKCKVLDEASPDKFEFEVEEFAVGSEIPSRKLLVSLKLNREGNDTKAQFDYKLFAQGKDEPVLTNVLINRMASFHYALCRRLEIEMPETKTIFFRALTAYFVARFFVMKALNLGNLSLGWMLFGIMYSALLIPAIASDIANQPLWYICATDITAALLAPGIFMYAIQIKSENIIKLWFYLLPFLILGEFINVGWEISHIPTYMGQLQQSSFSVILNILLVELLLPLPALLANARLGLRVREFKT